MSIFSPKRGLYEYYQLDLDRAMKLHEKHMTLQEAQLQRAGRTDRASLMRWDNNTRQSIYAAELAKRHHALHGNALASQPAKPRQTECRNCGAPLHRHESACSYCRSEVA
jgi:hypothetical protein